jgi:regulator of PEP synthase PpsR (kinase-PPPase family)
MAEPHDENHPPIFLLSDSTGDTAASILRAALAQFERFEVHITTYAHVTDRARLEGIIRLASEHGALVFFTLVDPSIRNHVVQEAARRGVPFIDLIGPIISSLSAHLGGLQARGEPGRRPAMSDEYFKRIEAVEFTVKHDDGAEPRHLHKADIILVGVSRTSKTPLSTYLAQKGWKVSNVPIVLGIEPPKELYEVDQERVFALTIVAETLHQIRMARIRNLGLATHSNYGHIDHIYMELEYANEIFRRNPAWPVIDVTHRAIEESAAVVLQIYSERRQAGGRAQTIRG